MRKSLIASLLLHAAILVWLLVDFPFAREFDAAETPSLPVDIVTPSELTRLKAGSKDANKEEAAAKEKPADRPAEAKTKSAKEEARRDSRSAEAVPAPKPAEAAPKPDKAEPKPERKPEPQTAAAPPPLPRPAPPKPKVAASAPDKPAERKTAPRQSDFDPDRIAALLNKVPDVAPRGAPDGPQPDQPEPARGASAGRDLAMSISELDALRARISQCWIPPVGGMGAEPIRVRLRLRLNPDGTLMRAPEVVNAEASPFFQAAADAAVRAVWQCQPYALPATKYELWRDMILNFDPREMFGG